MKRRGWAAALLLLVPFLLVASCSRAMVPAWGDWVAFQLRLAVRLTPHVLRAPVPPPLAPLPPAAPPPTPPEAPLRSVTRRGSEARVAPSVASPPDASVPAAPLRIPASKVQRAIDDGGRSMHARTTYDAAGRPIGARISGVNGAGLGLRDGDVIVAVDGKPTADDDAATDAALSLVARGASVLRARLIRDGQPFDVIVELPLAPELPGKDAR